jgi:hypothetical protein
MSKNKVEVLLSKIKSLTSDDEISLLEKDLIKGYIKDLYLLVDHIPIHTDKSTNLQKEIGEDGKEGIPHPKAIEKPIIQPEEKPRLIEEVPPRDAFKSGNGYQPMKDPVQPIFSAPGKPKESQIPAVDLQQQPIVQPEPVPLSMEALFTYDQSTELSEKLANQPITDLNKAFSINERLLFTNELFRRNNETFLDIIDVINRKYSFEEAKSYLIRYVIDQYQWMDEKRIERAHEFISFVRRRYLD